MDTEKISDKASNFIYFGKDTVKKTAAACLSFEEFCKLHELELRPWQKEAAEALLNKVYPEGKQKENGVTVLMYMLGRFLDTHGNNNKHIKG